MKNESLLLCGMIGLATISLQAAPANAQNLGLTLDAFVKRVGAASDAAGESLTFKELACMENPKPGDEIKKIVSCTHTLGNGRLLITNAEPEGPLLDIATQPWEGGRTGLGALMIYWIASAINDSEPQTFREAAGSLANTAIATGQGNAIMGNVAFYIIGYDNKLTITAQSK